MIKLKYNKNNNINNNDTNFWIKHSKQTNKNGQLVYATNLST